MGDERNFFDDQQVERIVRSVLRTEGQQPDVGRLSFRQGFGRGSLNVQRWLPAENDGSVTIPAYSVVYPTGGTVDADADLRRKVNRIDTTFRRVMAATGPDDMDTSSSTYGAITYDSPMRVKYDESDGTPATGECWGPKPDTFILAKGYPGFSIVQVVDDEEFIVEAVLDPPVHLMGKADSNIDSMSSDTPGTGDVTIWLFDEDGDVFETDFTVEGVNLASSDVTADKMLQLKWYAGKWLIDFEDCPAS